jgi:hypothetical protein
MDLSLKTRRCGATDAATTPPTPDRTWLDAPPVPGTGEKTNDQVMNISTETLRVELEDGGGTS